MSLWKNLSQKCVRLAVFIFLVAASALAAQAQVVFSPPKNVSNSSGNTQSQQIAVDAAGNINLVWVDTSPGNAAIFFSRSSDAGSTFSTPVSISKHAQSTASSPHVAVDSAGNVSVVWTETSPDGSANFIYFNHSTNGVTFTNPQNISGDAGAATGPRIAVDSSGGVSVVWVDTSVGNSEIFFSHSADGGTTFSTPLNISSDAGDSLAPQIAVDPMGNINVAWQDDTPGIRYDIFFSRSSDGGVMFSAPLQVTHSISESRVLALEQLAAGANGNIYLLWIQFIPLQASSESVSFSRSTDGGQTFSFAGGIGFSSFGMMGLDPSSNDIGVVARNDVDQEFSDILFNFSSDSGGSFSGARQISASGASSPQIVVDAIGRFDITYSQGFSPANPRNFPEGFFFTQIVNGGDGAGAILSSSLPTSSVMALDSSGNVYVAWDQLPASGGNANIFFSRGVVTPFSLGISPTSVVGGSGGTVTGTVKLVAPAPAGGAVISLSSNNPAASVPGSVTVPEGANSATFTISTNQVSSQTVTEISATFDGGTNTASLVVEPAIASVSFEGSPVGGNPAVGDVVLGLVAPSGGVVVSLTSSNPSVVSVPASTTVPAGSIFQQFPITTSPVTAPTTVQITATTNGFTKTTSVTIQPPTPQQLSVSPTTATGGASSTGTVRLTGPAPAGGAAIALSSSDPSATVPASVTIPAGSTSASFTITTNPGSSTTNVTISASYNGVSLNASLTVQPLILSQLEVFQPTIGGGGSVLWGVCMNVQVPSATTVSFSTSAPSIASVPGGSVTIPQGSACANFNINTSAVSANTNVTISASFNGVTRTGTLTVQPIVLQFVFSNGDMTGGTSQAGTIIFNGPPANPAVVSLSSSNPSLVSVPATVTMPPGQNAQNFTMTASPVTAPTSVTITASYNGVTVSVTFTVHPQ